VGSGRHFAPHLVSAAKARVDEEAAGPKGEVIMSYDRIVISSGHGKYVRGACGILDEVDEARKVVEQVAIELRNRGADVKVFHDDTSRSQNENLNTIVNYHNRQTRDLDVSVHFNAYEQVSKPMGTEVLYVTQSALAGQVSKAIATAGGLINRGAKKRTDLFFLNSTTMPSILIEVCFVDSEADANLYGVNFDAICAAVADVLGGAEEGEVVPPPEPEVAFSATGKVSYFGGPDDAGVSPSEGLAFIQSVDDAPQLFLPFQPEGTTGLARRLNPYIHYVACRWDYNKTPKAMMLEHVALVRAPATGIEMKAFPADWGPNENTGRVADISPGLMDDLGIQTDDEVEVIFPYKETAA
jgi:N-acetylmuramoyl-L-alanine amidase